LIEAWRITKAADIQNAFSGEGARLYGGRWNSKGTPMVYVASTRSLAMLEILVHVRNAPQPANSTPYNLYSVRFDESLLEELSLSQLSSDWDLEPPTRASKSIGDEWVNAARTPVLSVPSVVVPEEANYLLNPAHPLFGRIHIGPPIPYTLDRRLL
jgi:RES domain-containing protein